MYKNNINLYSTVTLNDTAKTPNRFDHLPLSFLNEIGNQKLLLTIYTEGTEDILRSVLHAHQTRAWSVIPCHS